MTTTLIEKIRADRMTAMKQKNVFLPLLSTLLGEAERVGKDKGNRPSTDDEVIAVVKKFIKNNDETIAALTNRVAQTNDGMADNIYRIESLRSENSLLLCYLPKQLSLQDLQAIAVTMSAQPIGATMGTFMKFLKDNHPGQYDGKLAKEAWESK